MVDYRIQTVMDNNSEIQQLYHDIEDTLAEQGKRISIFCESRNNNELNIQGITEDHEEDNIVTVAINSGLVNNSERLIAILIHELGEASYIANRLPHVTAAGEQPEWNQTPEIMNLREIFTHNYINKWIENNNLQERTECIRHENMSLDFENNVVGSIHQIVTDNLQYPEYENEYVNKILEILNNIQNEDDINLLEINYNEIINILRENFGFNKEISIIRRDK